jgi:hypothetical protein
MTVEPNCQCYDFLILLTESCGVNGHIAIANGPQKAIVDCMRLPQHLEADEILRKVVKIQVLNLQVLLDKPFLVDGCFKKVELHQNPRNSFRQNE